jgi:hypothetical protein
VRRLDVPAGALTPARSYGSRIMSSSVTPVDERPRSRRGKRRPPSAEAPSVAPDAGSDRKQLLEALLALRAWLRSQP